MRPLHTALLFAVFSASCAHAPTSSPEMSDGLPAAKLRKLGEDYWDLEMRKNPIWATYLGDRRFDEELPDLSPEGVRQRRDHARFLFSEVRGIPEARLDAPDQITREILLLKLERELGVEVCRAHLWDVNALDGIQTTLGELPQLHGVETPAHAKALVTRYVRSADVLDQHVANLRTGMKDGYLAAKVAVNRVIVQLDAMLADVPSFVETVPLPEGWSAAEKAQTRAELTQAVRERMFPALTRYRDFLRDEYLAKARDEVGVRANPNGEACYRARIAQHTGLSKSAEEIHAVGLAQAQQNVADMKEIARRLIGSEDLRALKAHLSREPSQRVDSREALMAFASGLIDRAKQKLPESFGRLPKLEVEVKAIEAFREQQSATGYYYSGSLEQKRPGYFYLNTYEPQSRVLLHLESLTFHEAVPGHHLQTALAQELEELPRFRRELDDGAFTEGWAHYAELLADELGMYSGDAGRFGMLSDQAMRAARLVVDTGMHHLEWSRERALQYMLENTAEPPEELEREIDRYIVWPGQALSYKTGQLVILELRAKARAQLGERFDLRAFHDEVLSRGSIPLPILERVMTEWIEAQATRPLR